MKVLTSFHMTVVVASLALAGCSDTGSEFSSYRDGDIDRSSAHEQGIYHFAAGQFGLAVQYFERAAERNPRSVEAVNGLAAAYDRLGRFDLAERQYRRALSIDPQSAQTLNNLGYSYWLQGRYDLALTYLREAEQHDGSNSVIATNLKNVVEAYQREGALADAAQPTESAPVELAETAAPVRETWIERTTPNVQTLITRPSSNLLAAAKRSDLPPRLLSYQGAAEEPLASFMFEADDALAPSPLGKSRQLAGSSSGSEREVPLVARTAASQGPSLLVLTAGADAAPAGIERLDSPLLVKTVVAPQDVAETAPEAKPLMKTAQGDGLRFDGQPLGPLELQAHVPIGAGAAAAPEAHESAVNDLAVFYSRRDGAMGVLPGGLAKASSPVETEFAGNSSLIIETDENSVAPTIVLTNALGVDGMAARLRDYLNDRGLPVDSLSNAENFGRARTMIYYRDGWRVYAMGLASILPAAVVMEPRQNVAGDIRIELGGDLLNFDRHLSASRAPLSDDSSG